jgi:pantothenate kinase type III
MTETGQGAPLLVLSGGTAHVLEPRLNLPCMLVDNLVLDGLLEIAHEGS